MTQHVNADTLIDYLHGGLPSEADAQIYAHLQSCETCRKAHDAEAALGEELRAHAAREERELPPTVKAEIWARIRAAQPSKLSALVGLLRPARMLPIAAAIALAAYFGVAQFGSNGAPAIDAAYYLQDHAAIATTIPFTDRAEASPANLETQASLGATQTAVRIETASYTADANP